MSADQSRPTDEQLLKFEAAWPRKHNGHKEEAIRRQLDIPPVRYYQLLGRLIWTEAALAIDPITTNRLRRISMDQQLERARRLG